MHNDKNYRIYNVDMKRHHEVKGERGSEMTVQCIKKKNCLYSVFRVKLVVDRPIWRCGRRRVDLTRVFDMLEGGRGAC